MIDRSSSPPQPILIRALTPHDGIVLKTMRLRALSDSPTAFGSTFARESQLTDEQWSQKAATWSGADGGRSACCLAFDGPEPVGIAAGYVPPDEPDARLAWLVSMWVDPRRRRCGLGRRLIEFVEGWARRGGLTELRLEVTIGNDPAEQLYRAAGFQPTGEPVPHPVYAELRERVMVKRL